MGRPSPDPRGAEAPPRYCVTCTDPARQDGRPVVVHEGPALRALLEQARAAVAAEGWQRCVLHPAGVSAEAEPLLTVEPSGSAGRRGRGTRATRGRTLRRHLERYDRRAAAERRPPGPLTELDAE